MGPGRAGWARPVGRSGRGEFPHRERCPVGGRVPAFAGGHPVGVELHEGHLAGHEPAGDGAGDRLALDGAAAALGGEGLVVGGADGDGGSGGDGAGVHGVFLSVVAGIVPPTVLSTTVPHKLGVVNPRGKGDPGDSVFSYPRTGPVYLPGPLPGLTAGGYGLTLSFLLGARTPEHLGLTRGVGHHPLPRLHHRGPPRRGHGRLPAVASHQRPSSSASLSSMASNPPGPNASNSSATSRRIRAVQAGAWSGAVSS